MHYLSEKDIVDLVTKVIAEKNQGAEQENGMEVPVEMSGRHVHLDRATMDILFGEGAELAPKKELSQPGQYLAEERVKLVTERGQLSGVAVLEWLEHLEGIVKVTYINVTEGEEDDVL